MKIKANAATDGMTRHERSFSKECLDKMSKEAKGKPITVGFNPNYRIGEVESGWTEDNRFYVKCDINKDISHLLNKKMYCVPGV